MNTLNLVAAAQKVRELGLQAAGRVKIARALGVSARQADKVAKLLREKAPAKPQEAPAPRELKPVAAVEGASTRSAFAKRNGPEELSNWRTGWVREHAEPQLITSTDRKGVVRTDKVIHDPGVCWPAGYKGAKWSDDMVFLAKPPRRIKSGVVLTAAQSQTPLHGPSWINLVALALHYGAQFSVGGVDYKLPGQKSQKDEISQWSSLIEGYVNQDRIEIGDLVIASDYPIPPTVESPLANVESYCQMRTHVFSAVRQSMRTLPSFYDGEQQFAWSTGCITMPNYAHTAAGVRAISHHHFGAVLVLWDEEGKVYSRNVRCDPVTGDLFDIDVHVSGGVVRDAPDVIAERDLPRPVVNLGDIHRRWLNDAAAKAMVGLGGSPKGDVSLVDAVDPGHIIVHDVVDGYSVTPHNRNSPMLKLRRKSENAEDLFAELKEAADFIQFIGSPRRKICVIDSNHDKHVVRHIFETDWKTNIVNSEIHLQLSLAAVQAAKRGDWEFSPFEYGLRLANPDADFDYISPKTSLCPIAHHYQHHGNEGPNGSTGTASGFHRFGVPINIGDKHSGYLNLNLVIAFANIDKPPYVRGSGTWSKGAVVEQPDGFIQMIPFVGDRFRP